jgi:hypothetical protein
MRAILARGKGHEIVKMETPYPPQVELTRPAGD